MVGAIAHSPPGWIAPTLGFGGVTFSGQEAGLIRHTGSVSSAEVKNLEAISKAIDQHNSSCPWPAAEVRMNPFEVDRLGWDQIRGLPLVPDPDIGTGRFVIVCSRDADGEDLEEAEAVGEEYVTVGPSPGRQGEDQDRPDGPPAAPPGFPGWN